MADPERLRAAHERIGRWLNGKYHLERLLGMGGMGAVYAATHRNKKRVAIKVLHPDVAVRAISRERFVREGYVANSVRHPGVVSVHDDDQTADGVPFLVMELLDGATVEQCAARAGGRVPLQAALVVAHALCDALAAAHARGILHRDVKPSNVFVLRDGSVRVLDFGVARLHDVEGVTVTKTGTALGTPAFMPPEQTLGKMDALDARSDVWSVGATLFTALSGEYVHTGETPQEMMVNTATRAARSLASVTEGTPEPVVALVARALRVEKEERWDDAGAMRDAIAAAYAEIFGEPLSRAPLAAFMDTLSAPPESERSRGVEVPTAASVPCDRPVEPVPARDPAASTAEGSITLASVGTSIGPAALPARSGARRSVVASVVLFVVAASAAAFALREEPHEPAIASAQSAAPRAASPAPDEIPPPSSDVPPPAPAVAQSTASPTPQRPHPSTSAPVPAPARARHASPVRSSSPPRAAPAAPSASASAPAPTGGAFDTQ